jgi:hypothetical protein
MAKNSYFRRNIGSEQRLIEDLTVEAIKMHGEDMVYIPRTLMNEDKLFGEDTQSKFDDGYSLEMYIESADGFEGDGDFVSKFGLEIRDSVSLIFSKKRFEQVVTVNEASIPKPREGDLIYFPLSKGLFEIKFVEHENPFYQLGKLHTYKVSCELFVYSHEEIDTGYSDIDALEDDRQEFEIELTLGTLNAGQDFRIGEEVYQGSVGSETALAKVTDWTLSTKLLSIVGISGTFSNSQNVIGRTTETSYSLDSQVTTTTVITQGVTGGSDGDNESIEFEIDSDSIFDFTENDPFSEGNY